MKNIPHIPAALKWAEGVPWESVDPTVLDVLNRETCAKERSSTIWVELIAREFARIKVPPWKTEEVLRLWVQASVIRDRLKSVIRDALDRNKGDKMLMTTKEHPAEVMDKLSPHARGLWVYFHRVHGYTEFSVGYKELIEKTGIPKTTLIRVIKELEHHAFLMRDAGHPHKVGSTQKGTNVVTSYQLFDPELRRLELERRAVEAVSDA